MTVSLPDPLLLSVHQLTSIALSVTMLSIVSMMITRVLLGGTTS